jgi:Flp pilus assembly protein TadG
MAKRTGVCERRGERGNAIVEVALMIPWIFFLFVGVFDFGFFAYAAICTEGAARAAAVQLASSPDSQLQSIACTAATAEMIRLPNNGAFNGTCSAAPLVVTIRTLCTQASVIPTTITCTAPGCADCTSDPAAASSEVTVTYQSVPMAPIPGILMGQMNLTRKVEMRIVVP